MRARGSSAFALHLLIDGPSPDMPSSTEGVGSETQLTTYTWNAEDYERNSQAQLLWARELMRKLRLTGSEDVLDLGCGDGKVTAEIAGKVGRGSVVGVDSSSAMIELAKRQYPDTKYDNLSFVVMDASDLSFAERFDIAFSNAALHWIENHRPVVEGVYRSLRPGGRILFQMGGKGNANGIERVLKQVAGRRGWCSFFDDFQRPYGFLGTEEYERLLVDAGFIAKRIELIPKDMEQDGKEGLAGWIRTTWLPFTERIPEANRDGFVDEVCSEYVAQFPKDAQGKVHIAMVRLEVEAEKSW